MGIWRMEEALSAGRYRNTGRKEIAVISCRTDRKYAVIRKGII